ncbi:hypothetical protein HPP92_013688 [Vanilla planifolia]|uniref:Uncharacterized protein n=1 Tax=Vanilla planifolia TaxID=51239 RepID=A0A835QUI3_VANPL|nr:hypothetical protein HPP92_014137 [Vanilla planifolia]KAG0478969.1 hypothetical protein HPP92_013688 [Vanilla planifolia]
MVQAQELVSLRVMQEIDRQAITSNNAKRGIVTLLQRRSFQAIEIGHVAVRNICLEVETFVKKCGKPKMLDAIKMPPSELYKHVEDISQYELVKALQIRRKIPRRKALSALEEKVICILTESGYVLKDRVPGIAEGLIDNCDDKK